MHAASTDWLKENWLKLVPYGITLVGALVGFGKMQADVEHLKTSLADARGRESRIESKLDRLYDHIAWREKGGSGPSEAIDER